MNRYCCRRKEREEKEEKARRKRERERKRKEKLDEMKRCEEERVLALNIAKEERKILVAQRKLESIRLLTELFDRVKVRTTCHYLLPPEITYFWVILLNNQCSSYFLLDFPCFF